MIRSNNKKFKIVIFGTSYVGLASAIAFAQHGHQVVGIGRDRTKTRRMQQGWLPIHEPGLPKLFAKHLKSGRLSFDSDGAEAIGRADIIFIAVGTPAGPDGKVDISQVETVARKIGRVLSDAPIRYRLIVNKSTVPIGTGDVVSAIVKKFYPGPFNLVSNPEFLAQGCAIETALHPDRTIIGLAKTGQGDRTVSQAKKILEQLYNPFKAPVVWTDLKSAELIKYSSNAFLPMSISFINSLAELAELIGADISDVTRGMRLDSRIGPKAFLEAGVGFGGSCFPKDMAGLIAIAKDYGTALPLVEQTLAINKITQQRVVTRLKNALGGLKGKPIALLGLAFKPHTNDVRFAPSLEIAQGLITAGASVRAYDPIEQARQGAKDRLAKLQVKDSIKEALTGAQAVVLVTEWPEFIKLKPNQIARLMTGRLVFDGRNAWNPKQFKKAGLHYLGVGRGRL